MPRLPEHPGRVPIARPREPRHRPAILLVVLAALVAVALTVGPRPAAAPAAAPAPGRSTALAAVPGVSRAVAVAAGPVTPNVIGRPVSEAGAELIAAGYRAPVSWRADPAAVGAPCSVVRQDPPAGRSVQAGTQATLVVVRGSCR